MPGNVWLAAPPLDMRKGSAFPASVILASFRGYASETEAKPQRELNVVTESHRLSAHRAAEPPEQRSVVHLRLLPGTLQKIQVDYLS